MGNFYSVQTPNHKETVLQISCARESVQFGRYRLTAHIGDQFVASRYYQKNVWLGHMNGGLLVNDFIDYAERELARQGIESDLKREGNMEEVYGYYINLDERGCFHADADSEDFEIIVENDDEMSLVESGYMTDLQDVSGLASYLRQVGIISQNATVLPMQEFESALPERNNPSASPR